MFSSNYCFHMFALPGVKKSNTTIKLASDSDSNRIRAHKQFINNTQPFSQTGQ